MANITIVGGGTAGWLAAFVLSKIHNHSITVIESSQIGIIGVGEGGTHVIGTLINSANELGFNTREFMQATDATPKMAVHHCGWPNSYYLPLDLLSNSDNIDFLPYLIATNNPGHLGSEMGLLLEEKITPIRKDETGIWDTAEFSFHFDGHKVGQFFKSKCSNVQLIDSVVNEVMLTESGEIKELRLDNNTIQTADLYIDCTGFQQVLMKALGNTWISYKKHLLMNSAVPYRLPVFSVQPVTTSESMSAGWTWNIPTALSQGLGYVYCDEFITYEQVIAELEKKHWQTIEPVKKIKFEAGRLKYPWLKNCVALGLASAFVEPLEATSIHATKIQLDELAKLLNNQEYDTNSYNQGIGNLYDSIKDFIVLHYLGGKSDSEFWRHCNNGKIATDRVNEILEIANYRFLTEDDIPNPYNSLSYRAWNQVLAGLGKFSKEIANDAIDGNIESVYNSWKKQVLLKAKDYKTLHEVIAHRTEWWNS